MNSGNFGTSLRAERETMLDQCFIFPGWKSLHQAAPENLAAAEAAIEDLHALLAYIYDLMQRSENDQLFVKYLGCSAEDLARARRLRRPEQSFLYKWDVIATQSGFKCLEIDLGADLGGMLQSGVHDFLDRHGMNGRWRCPGSAFIGQVKQRLDDANSHGLVCLLDSPDFVSSYQKYYGPISRHYEAMLGRPCVYASVDQLHFGETVTYDGTPVESFLEITCFKDLVAHHPNLASLYETAVLNNMVLSLTDPMAAFLSGKSFFVLLNELADTGALPSEIAATVRRYIPKTIFITAANQVAVADAPDEWVIKHSEGMGGNAVFPGWTTSREKWYELITQACDSQVWIVQQRIQGMDYESLVCSEDGTGMTIRGPRILALFALGERFIGGHVRAGEGAVVNASSGAGIGVLRFR